MGTKNIQLGKMRSQLEQWGAKLEAFASKSTADAKADQTKLLAELKAKHKIAKAKLHELEAAGSDKWETMKTGLVDAYEDLEGAFKDLVST